MQLAPDHVLQTDQPGTGWLGPSTRLRLYPLSIHREEQEFLVGRPETGTFAAVPPIAVEAIRLIQQGLALGDVQARLDRAQDADVDLGSFLNELLDLDFIEAIDGRQLATQEAPPPHLGWLKPRHVGWIFGWPGRLAFAALMTSGLLSLIQQPGLLPRYRDFYWSASTSVVLAGNALWLILNLAAHELAHLVAARSLNLPARITLSTRLHYLVAQTDLSALWSVPRRQRFRAYLAGIAWDLIPIALALTLSAFFPLPAQLKRMLAAMMLLNWLGILWQFNLYLRTDMYYVVQELLRRPNLYQHSLAYLHARGRDLLRLLRVGSAHQIPHPLRDLSAGQRRQVRAYAGLILLGSAGSLTVFLAYTVPVLISLLAQVTESMLVGVRTGAPLTLLDGVVSAVALLAGQLLFVVVFLRNRRTRRRSSELPDPLLPA